MIKIKCSVFSKNTSNIDLISNNGIVLDSILTSAISKEELETGYYNIDLTFVNDKEFKSYLIEENILKLLRDDDYEFFYITKVEEEHDYIYVTASQITTYLCLSGYLEDVRVVDAGCQTALTKLSSYLPANNKVTFNSDITTKATGYYVDQNVYEAIWDDNNCITTLYNAETQRRKFTVTLNQHIGSDKGFTITEGKNITGFRANTNIDEVYTKVRGKGFNGIMGNWQTSNNTNLYRVNKSKTIEYKVRVREEGKEDEEGYAYFDTEAQAISELNRLAKLEFTVNQIDTIKTSYTINFAMLKGSKEYDKYGASEQYYLGDTVSVYIPRLGVDIKNRIVSVTYNHLTQSIEEVELRNYTEPKALSIRDVVDKVSSLENSQTSLFEQAKQYSSDLIKAGLTNSYVVVRNNEILIMNTKDINTATRVWRWNNNGLGYSSTGYNGTYGTALTADGKIVADRILTGVLKAIQIQNMDGSLKLDLSDNNKGIQFYANNTKAIEIKNSNILFYNIKNDGQNVGYIGTGNIIANGVAQANKPVLAFDHENNSAITFGYKNGNAYSPYMRLDKNGLYDGGSKPINFYEGCDFYKENYHYKGINMLGNTIFLLADGSAYVNTNRFYSGDIEYVCTRSPNFYATQKVFAGGTELTGADYSECFEWLDENIDNEDRTGFIVTLEGNKIRKANIDDEVIGIISNTASVIGDNANEWNKKYLTDKWGRYILDENNERIINPDYDETKKYTSRSGRKEWGVVGLLGKIYTKQDGTIEVGDYIKANNGIATKSDIKTNIRCIEKIDNECIRVFIK